MLSPARFVSWVTHQRDVAVGASFDAGSRDTREDEKLEILIDDVVAELGDRQKHCGGEDRYPFSVNSGGLEYNERAATLSYRFQLLLTVLGHNAAPVAGSGDQLFEDLCAEALYYYLGGRDGTERCVFGFPRRLMPGGFPEAVDSLCRVLGEGDGAQDVPESSDQKDAYLDVVAWRHFPDRRHGKLIVFGQCATGVNWKTKFRDLQPRKWCSAWMSRMPTVTPVPAFFVPRRAEPTYWRRTSIYGGIVFDRCRVAYLTRELEVGVANKLRRWTEAALEGCDP